MSTKKAPSAAALVKRARPDREFPKPIEGATLLEQGVACMIKRVLADDRAPGALENLKKVYVDWNEARVSQLQELIKAMVGSSKLTKKAEKEWKPVARLLKDYLQEVFQETHGLDIEFFRDDQAGAAKLMTEMPVLGFYDGSYLLWIASGQEMPMHAGMVRVLDRVGLITRTTSMKKARVAITPLAAKGDELGFAATLGHISEKWCDSRKPTCQECPLVDDCKYGKKVFIDWQKQQARLELQRQKEEERRLIAEKKEAERLAREEERARKKAEAAAKKTERERAKKRREQEQKRAAAAAKSKKEAEVKAKKEAEIKAKKQAIEQARKDKESAKKKAAADKKKAAAAAKKKAATVAAAAKKKATAAAATAKKKAAAKKPTKKKVVKKAASSSAAKKKTTKKPVAKKVTKKAVSKKAVTKKPTNTTKKKVAKKTAKKKTVRRR